jgi:hypothetical protein
MGLLIGFRSFFEWRSFSLERLEATIHLLQTLPGKTPAGMPNVNEPVVVEVTEKQSADMRTTVSGFGEAADDKLLPELDL